MWHIKTKYYKGEWHKETNKCNFNRWKYVACIYIYPSLFRYPFMKSCTKNCIGTQHTYRSRCSGQMGPIWNFRSNCKCLKTKTFSYHHALGRDRCLVRVDDKIDRAHENLVRNIFRLWFIFQQDNDHTHTDKATMERYSSVRMSTLKSGPKSSWKYVAIPLWLNLCCCVKNRFQSLHLLQLHWKFVL